MSAAQGSADTFAHSNAAGAAKEAAANDLSSYQARDHVVRGWTQISYGDTPVVLRDLLGRKLGGLLDMMVHVETGTALREGDTLPWVFLAPSKDVAKVVYSHEDGTQTVYTLKLVDDAWVIDSQVEVGGK